MEKNKNEKLAIIIGFSAIFLVIIFTLVREKLHFFSNDKQELSQENSTSTKSDKPAHKTIGAKELNKKIIGKNKNEKLTLLDVRPFESYIAEHIIDTVNITPEEFPLKSKLDAHNLIVVIGENILDENINKTVNQLKEEDFDNTVVLAGGMSSWKEQIGLTVTYGNPKSFVDQAKVSYIDPENLNDAFVQKIPMYILDTRSNEEFNKGHIPGAVNIPMDQLEKRRDEISVKKVVVVGANELQEFQASVQIYDMLMASPYIMRGAMPKWEEKKFPMVK